MSYDSMYRKFIFHGYEWNREEKKITFTYSFDRSLFFQEDVSFRSSLEVIDYNREAFDRACQLAHLLSGISYYKAYPTQEIELDTIKLDAAQAEFFNALYTNGLGEYLFENELEPSVIAKFPAAQKRKPQVYSTGAKDGRLLLIGGGKDSLVSTDILKKNEIPFTQFRVDPVGWVRKQMDTINGNQIFVHRKISKNLLRLNKKDALNGHVPITGILMSLAVITAVLTGKRDIILSNESSANEPNVQYRGIEVNHQYSKSFEFEKLMQDYISDYVADDIRIFSLLRPLTELSIAEYFAENLWEEYSELFSSSNSNFKRGKNSDIEWDPLSPKTASVFGLLSAFLKPEQLLPVFKENLYEKNELKPVWRQLFGQEDHKPFECVASVDEMRTAAALAQKNGWGQVARRFQIPEEESNRDYKEHEAHNLPDTYEKALNQYKS